jgi:hypothetical protein
MRIRRALPFAQALALFPLLSGCATIAHGNHQTVHVETDPPGATFTLLGKTYTTPVDVEVPRKAKDVEVVLGKDGYAVKRVALARKRSSATWANLLWIPAGAGIGALAASGSSEWFAPTPGESAAGGAVAGAIVSGVSLIVDGASGANYGFDPPFIAVKLEPAPSAAPAAPTP